ncbi:hypothetical protein JOC78_001361 [Bacillus ectoiniformans]|uniref:S-layer homology domain-containing protein n=1 Tax=Bacillus ectoiniformans TaxID=1494429 RepID=UPI00195DD5F0|nr:S-layer homology domain-containing protein [Bacillus ectoiniformans]MBM7648419.1 hypothetical protein [Bacillus ectoiniformans]
MPKKRKEKFFYSALSISVAAGALTAVAPSVSAEQHKFTDVKAEDHFYDAVNSLHVRGVINGYDREFRPYAKVTRAQAAKIIAMALNMNTKNIKDPGFKDVPKKDWAYEYVAALSNAGIMKGYGDQFKPNEPLSRAQMAKIIALSFKLGTEKLEKSPFEDVKTTDWYAEYVKPLVDKEITTGTTPTTFSPNQPVLRGQMASFIYRSEHVTKGIQVRSEITNITNQDIVTKAGTYALPADLKGWLNSANLAALKGGQINLTVKDGKVEKVESVELKESGKASSESSKPYADHMVFDAKGATIQADVIVSADYLTLKNAKIKGDLKLGEGVKNSFYSDHLTVEGKTIVADEVKASAQQTNKFYQSLTYKQYASKLQEKTAVNNQISIIFDNSNLGAVQVNKSNVNVQPKGSSKMGLVSLSGNVTFRADDSVVIPRIVIEDGVQHVVVDSDVAEIVVEGNQSITISGSGDFGKVVADQSSTVTVQTSGTVGTLQTADKTSRFVLGNNTKVKNLVLPPGVKPQEAISNYENVKNNVDQIGGVKNPDVPPPATGGGSVPDRMAPTVTAQNQSIASEADALITSTETGAVYLVPVGATPATKADLDTLVTGGTAKTANVTSANTSVTISTTGLTIGAYKLYAIDRSGNVSQPVSITITKHPAVVAVESAIEQLKNKNDFTFNDRPAFYSAEYSHYVLTDNQKAQVDAGAKVKLTSLKTLIDGWERDGSGADVTDSKVSYDKDTGQLVLNINDGLKVTSIDLSRIKINSGNGSVELSGAYSVQHNKVTITLPAAKKTEVNNLITAAGGIGNTWIHLGGGTLLNEKHVPAKLTKSDIPLESGQIASVDPTVNSVELAIDQLPDVNSFTFNDRPAFHSAEYSHFLLTEDQKSQVSAAHVKKLSDLKTLVTDWETNGSGATVTDTKVTYDQTTGQLVLNVNDATKVAAVDLSRTKVSYGTANVTSLELAGTYVIDGNRIIISLTDSKKAEVDNLITNAGGVGNTWIHLGDGSLLDSKQVPAKLTNADIALEKVPTTTGTLQVSAATVQENSTVDVTVTDADLNKNPNVIEKVNVLVGNETLELTETGNNSDSFTGTTASLPSGSVIITYVDKYDVNGNENTVSKTITVTPQQN